MPTTGAWSIATVTDAAALIPLENLFNGVAQAVANGLAAGRVPQAVASSAARDAKYPSPATGDRVYRTDIGCEQVYFGGAWKTLATRFVGARLIKNVVQSTTTGTNSITWNSVGAQYDTDSMYSTGTNTRLNIPSWATGGWLISWTLRTGGVGGFTARLGVNGTGLPETEWGSGGATGGASTVGGTDILNLSGGDYIFVQHEAASAGSSFTIGACRLQARYLGQL